MLAQVIGEAESLIVRNDAGIASVADLAGKRVAVPVGSTAHFSLMGALAHAGIPEGDVTVMNMPPDQIAAAWEQGAIDAAFIWQPVQSQILETGTLLVGADETAAWGYPTFDGWVVDRTFAAENAEAMAAFARTMDEANAAYLADPAAWTADSAQVATIAEQTGADPAQVPGILGGFAFIPLSEQLGETWLGSAPATMKSTADFLVTAGRIDAAADDYSSFVNTDIGAAASQ
jgi:taurine transport system substrate-binding protein